VTYERNGMSGGYYQIKFLKNLPFRDIRKIHISEFNCSASGIDFQFPRIWFINYFRLGIKNFQHLFSRDRVGLQFPERQYLSRLFRLVLNKKKNRMSRNLV